MLGLMQIMSYMLNQLEYSEQEIREHFQQLEAGEYDLDDLMESIGLEFGSPTIRDQAILKISKWPSALAVTLMRAA